MVLKIVSSQHPKLKKKFIINFANFWKKKKNPFLKKKDENEPIVYVLKKYLVVFQKENKIEELMISKILVCKLKCQSRFGRRKKKTKKN